MSEVTAIIETKRRQWGNLGQLIYTTDLELQAAAQSAQSNLPTDFNDIPAAEAQLTLVKQSLAEIKERRMKITNPVKAKMEELMLPEKQLQAAIDQASANLLDAKQNAANLAKVEKAKVDELARIREAMANYIVKRTADHMAKITDKVVELFELALITNVPVDGIETWLDVQRHKPFLLADFAILKPPVTPRLSTTEQVDAIWLDLMATIPPEQHFLDTFHEQLKEKFGFYSLALNNKEAAIKQAQADAAESKAAVAHDASAQQVANKLNAMAMATPYVVPDSGKALKQSWEISMPDDEQSAVQIMAAFVANLAACRGGVRVKSWNKLTVEQMGAALCWAKKNDPAFQPSGVTFTQTSKL